MNRDRPFSAIPARSPSLLRARALLQLGPEAVDIGLVDDLGRDDDDRIGGNHRLVATDIFGHQLHALIAPLIGLLHDGADDRAFLDAAERNRIFVEPDDLDLAELTGFLHRLVDARRIVGVEADEAGDFRMGGHGIFDVVLGAGLVDVVSTNIDELDLRALDRLAHAFDALTRIVGGRQTDEAHALAAVGQRLEGELTRLLAGSRVARADVGDALGFRRVAVGGG